MKDRAVVQERYLRDSVPIRLGGLAANLLRIKSFAGHADNRAVVEGLLDESKFFIEWTARDTDIDAAAELVEIQIQISRWQRSWTKIWADPIQRSQVAEQTRVWSDRVLELSGLLTN